MLRTPTPQIIRLPPGEYKIRLQGEMEIER